ncbi:MAG TPA: hypothetical protein VG796_27015 [Verrucomicrobiales bacterium]|nr:hypothetical protein [Verrucomicrobiales bacterium]
MDVPIRSALIPHLRGAGFNATERTLVEDLKRLRPHLPGDLELRLEKGTVRLVAKSDSIYESRKAENPELKNKIADAALFRLFGVRPREPVQSTLTFPAKIPGESRDIRHKLRALNAKSEVTIHIDAGSTTGAVMRQMLQAGSFPLRTFPGGDQTNTPHGGPHERLLIPRIISNSQPMAEEVFHSPHRYFFEFNLIGGSLRPRHGSYCGPLSMMALKSWEHLRGDVSIIGASGFQATAHGAPAFACDHFPESQMKAALLAHGWLRSVIFDSSKLDHTLPKNPFALLTAKELDLVITDDGKTTGSEHQIESFVNASFEAGVAVLLVSSDDPEIQWRPHAKWHV